MHRLETPSLVARFLLALISVFAGSALGQSTGHLDPSFATGGKAVLSWSTLQYDIHEAMAVTTQWDGKLVVAGRTWSLSANSTCTVGRVHADGSVDSSFGTQGLVTVDFGVTPDPSFCNTLTLQGDGKILVAGGAHGGPNLGYDIAVARLHPNGSLDTSFGAGGHVTTTYVPGSAASDFAEAIVLQNDGKILVAATIGWPTNTDADFLAVRLLPNGQVDTTYGASGFTLVPFDLGGSNSDSLYAAALQADGKFVLAGSAENASRKWFAVSRLTVDGQLDPTFGTGGKQLVDFYPGQSAYGSAYDVLVDGSQRIVLAGEMVTPGAVDPTFALARLTPSGSLDTSFAGQGHQTIPFPYPHGSRAYAVAAVASDKLVAVGEASYTTTDQDFAAVRLLDDGTVDSSFGAQGRALVSFDIGSDKADVAADATVQLDGGIVVVGIVDTGSGGQFGRDWGLAKLTGEPFFSFP